MAVNVITVKCPQCGGTVEKGQKFCSYCGTQIIVKDDDEVELKKIDSTTEIEMKKLEVENRKDELMHKKYLIVLAFAGAMFLIGILLYVLDV